MGDVVKGRLVHSLEWCEQMKCDKASGQTLTWPPLQPTLHKMIPPHGEKSAEWRSRRSWCSSTCGRKKLWRVQVIDFRKPGASAPLFPGKLSSFLFRRARSRRWDVRPRRASFYSSAFLSSSSVEIHNTHGWARTHTQAWTDDRGSNQGNMGPCHGALSQPLTQWGGMVRNSPPVPVPARGVQRFSW